MKKNQVKIGAILSYLSLGLSSFISILYTPIMIRMLGQSEYGLYNLSNSIIGYLGVLDFGLGNAVVRYTAKYRALEDKEGEQNLHGMFIIIYSLLACLTIIAGLVLVSNIDKFFSNTLTIEELNRTKTLMGIMVFNLAISFPFGIFGGIINAYECFILPRVVAIIRAIINPLVMIPLLFMGYKSVGMAIVTTVINIVCIIVNLYYCFRVLKIKIKFKKFEVSVLKEISSYSFFIFLNMIVDKIYWSTDQFILGAVSGTASVAIYSVASTINTYYMNFSTAISSVFLPKVTKMVTKNVSDKEISDLFIKIGRIQYIILGFIMSGFIIVGREFILTWAGQEYYMSYYIALAVMLPFTIDLIQNISIPILQAKNMHQFRSNIYLAIAICNLIISIPLAKFFDGIGCALASGICILIGQGIIMNIYYSTKLKIDIRSFWKNILKMSIPVAISIILGIVVNSIINVTGYLGILIQGSIFSIIFFALMWLMGMNDYEKGLLITPINKITNKVLSKSRVA